MDRNQQKEKLEEKITDVSAEILALRTAGKSNSEEFNVLRAKLAGVAWAWAKTVFDEKKVKNASVEIMECIQRSIGSYTEGNYVNYLSAALKNEIGRANEKLKVFESRAISFPQKKLRKLRQMIRHAGQYGKDIADQRTQKWLSAVFGIPEGEIQKLVQEYMQTATVRENTSADGGEEISLFDTLLVSGAALYAPEAETVRRESLSLLLTQIDRTFRKAQERTQPYLSALLTRQILEELETGGVKSSVALNLLGNCSFAITDEGRKVTEVFLSGDTCPSQQEVAAWFGKDKSDASRTMKNFMEKQKSY